MDDDNSAGTASRYLSWWLSPGSESCCACEAPVHAEALAYCTACDRSVCMLCYDDKAGHGIILCPDCRREQTEGSI
ncbi:hypothetical protein CWI75_02380 [Kineobactrum sediminis]|uniref:Uncharacterized protein n=2 Tax=Kineobactrum sediminis TaxID=1905677 RepID=A0A2N5Y743_9GAMM|nr:hypothetical protein CWI75_02380 [Kineobactrum sediminis]